ncbi:MAG: LLM class flavin-dependent oxidoreductase [Gammaproteobacteria bacterium]
MALTLSCAFATSLDTPEHTRIAEQLGYARAWYYDSPALYPDVWVQLCRAAERTEQIGLATGVLVPHLRHPMTTAAAIATLVDVAGQDRVSIGVGTGFTACVSMGRRPLSWRYVSDYVRVVKALLRGEETEWDGGAIRMLHWPGFAAPRPIEVPFVYAAGGPKGIKAAQDEADGIFAVFGALPGFDWCVSLILGTVLDAGESAGSERALAAAGHGGAVIFHYAVEHDMLGMISAGEAWQESYEALPAATRHLTMHDGHLVGINDHDRAYVDGALLANNGLALDRGAWRERLAALEAEGTTEVAYQPAGPDIPHELEAFAALIDA